MSDIQKDIITMNKVYLLDKEILPIFGFRDIRDYKYVLYYDKMKEEIVEQLNNKLDDVFKLMNKKRFSLHKTNGKLVTVNSAFNFLKMYLEDVCIPFSIYNTKHKGIVSKCMRLVPINKLVYNYIMESEIPTQNGKDSKELKKDVVYEHNGWQVIIFSKETQEKYKDTHNYISPHDYQIYFYNLTYFQNFKENGREYFSQWRECMYVGLSMTGRFIYGQLNVGESESKLSLLDKLNEYNIIKQTTLTKLENNDYWEYDGLIIKAFEKGTKMGIRDDRCLFFGEQSDDVTYPCFYEYFVACVYHHKDRCVLFPTLKSGVITKMTDTQRFELNSYNLDNLHSAANQSARLSYIEKENVKWLVQDKIVKITFPNLIMKPSIDEINDEKCLRCQSVKSENEFFWSPSNYVMLAFKDSMKSYKIKVLDIHLGKKNFDLRLVLNVEKRKTFD
jgi:hypothetical protein